MKILLVEDARAVAALMVARLTTFGHEVIHAKDGKIAVEMFLDSAPDLILMDIEMPVMNGFEAANHIRAIEATQQWAWTPVIFLTASYTENNLITAIEAGGDDFMAKSVSEPVLQSKMKAMARIANLRQRLSVANQKLEEMANRDGLTALCNRRYMDLRLDAAFAVATQRGTPFALLMLDVDNFKRYNDHYGHQAGDDNLRSVAAAIDSVVGKANAEGLTHDAFAARYGGEEFAVVIPGASEDAYEKVAASIVGAVRQLAIPHEKNAGWGIVTISAGGTRLEIADGGVAAMFHAADERLYRAKERGRNRAETGG